MYEDNNILALLREKKGAIFLGGLLFAALSFLFLLATQKHYRVSTDFLVVQNGSSQDIYTLSKSAEYMGKVLGEGVYSELFIDSVEKTGKVNSEFLPFDKKAKLEKWSSIVKVNRNSELGILSIQTFDDNSNQAMGMANAVSEVLTTKNNLFRGEGQNIEVRILSGPVLEKNPGIMNIASVMVAGFVFGALVTIIGMYYKPKKNKQKYAFNLHDADYVYHPAYEEQTKNRMQQSGVFAQEEDYMRSYSDYQR